MKLCLPGSALRMGVDTSDGRADDNGFTNGDGSKGRICDGLDDTEGVDVADVDGVGTTERIIGCKRCLGHGL